MDKRSETISFRCPAELAEALKYLAVARDKTLSDLMCRIATDYVSEEHRLWSDLSRAFVGWKDLPGKPGTSHSDLSISTEGRADA